MNVLFNLCYLFYIVFVKCIKSCIVPHIIVQMDLPVDGVCINSPKTRIVCASGCETWTECNGSQLANLPLSPSMARSVGYDMKSVRFTEMAIPTIFNKLGNAKPKRISSLMEKLNRKRVWLSDNRVILKQPIGHSPVYAFENKIKHHLFANKIILLRPTQSFLWLCIIESTKQSCGTTWCLAKMTSHDNP